MSSIYRLSASCTRVCIRPKMELSALNASTVLNDSLHSPPSLIHPHSFQQVHLDFHRMDAALNQIKFMQAERPFFQKPRVKKEVCVCVCGWVGGGRGGGDKLACMCGCMYEGVRGCVAHLLVHVRVCCYCSMLSLLTPLSMSSRLLPLIATPAAPRH